MPSPLGLVDFTTPNYTSGFSGIPTQHKFSGGEYSSIITRGSKFYFRPIGDSSTIQTNRASESQPDRLYGNTNDDSINDIHNISLPSIISYCQQEKYPGMFLGAADFAYLRDLGVYPNNRLVICRRFPSPAPNDLTVVKMKPLSTLISWYDTEFPVKISFNENWESQDGDFVKTLDEMFNLKNTMTTGGGISGMTDVMNSATPLPGLSEGLQLAILRELGFTDANYNNLPQGNPNLLSEALVRKVGGEGLTSKIDLSFKTIYEQKFINNVDPELMFLDIIGNALRFGTSKSEFYITGKGGAKIREFFSKVFSGDFVGAITIIIDTIVAALKAFVAMVGQAASNFATAVTNDAGSALKDLGSTLLAPILSKYKVKLGGILSALTGEPSTPWHVTIGNPKKPIFSSGDMKCESVDIKFGDTLSFNDLPSTIEISFNLSGARNYGLQEIFDRFSCGAGRSYIATPSNFESQVTGTSPATGGDDSELKLTNAQVINLSQSDNTPDYLSDGDKARVDAARKARKPK